MKNPVKRRHCYKIRTRYYFYGIYCYKIRIRNSKNSTKNYIYRLTKDMIKPYN